MSNLSLKAQKEILKNAGRMYGTLCSVEDNRYTRGGEYWKVTTLIAAAKKQGCVKFKYDLCDMDFSWSWSHFGTRIIDVAYDAKRAEQADLKYPIIFSPVGGLLDGTHRIIKALMENRTWIYACKLKDMPDADGTEEKED